MKKLVIVISAFILGYNVHAQHKFGISGGLNRADVADDYGNEYIEAPLKPLIGFHLGVFLDSRLSDRFSLYTELQYSQRGVRDGFFAEEMRLGYLEMPVLLSWQTAHWLRLELGPDVACLLTSELKNEIGPYSKITFKRIDFGPTAGIRLVFNDNISAIVRYYYGLTRIADANIRDGNNVSMGTIDYSNRVIQLGIRITL